MKIGIFTNVLTQPLSGIGWHVVNLLSHLAHLGSEHTFYLLYRTTLSHPRQQLFKPPGEQFVNVPLPTPEFGYSRHFRLFDQVILPRAMARLKLDVFHGPNHYLPPRRRVPQVVTWHDLAEVKLPMDDARQRAKERCDLMRTLSRADRTIAISQCTQQDLIAFGYPAQRIDVIYPGGNVAGGAVCATVGERFKAPVPTDGGSDPARARRTLKGLHIRGRYVLHVGSLIWRKNVGTLLRAMAHLRNRHPDQDVQLVLAGANDTPHTQALAHQINALGLAHHVVLAGYLDQLAIEDLYTHADVVAVPSLYEGFGMVALEAMARDVPVVASRGGSLPEVVGQAGLLVDVEDHEGLAHAIHRVLNEPGLAERLIACGRKRVQQFSWETAARRTLALYESVAGRSA